MRPTIRVLCKTAPFARPLRHAQILMLDIFNMFMRLKLYHSLISAKMDRFSKVPVNKALYAILIPGAVFLGACGWFSGDEIPDYLLGQWTTSEPRYSDAQLEITKDRITFLRGFEYISMNRIDHVKISDRDERTLIRITYRDIDGGEFTLSLYYYPDIRGGTIRFVNQMQVKWQRDSESG